MAKVKPAAPKPTEPTFTPYPIKEGDRFDTVAYKAYGDPLYVHTLIMDNPHLQTKVFLPPGETMLVRIKKDPETGALLPPWFMDEEDTKPGDGDTGTVTPPVTEGPIVPLGFSQGFPKVEGNKILFAINKSERYTYTVERVGGGVISQSPGYDFSAGFAVETPEITEGGQYIVKVGPLTSQPIAMTGLSFSEGYPRFQQDNLEIKVTRNLLYLTKVVNKDTNAVIFNANHDFSDGQAFVIPGLAAGTYAVTVGNIMKEALNQSSGETSQKPSWLNKIAYTHNVSTQEFTAYVDATEDVSVRISAAAAPQPSGVSTGSQTWDSNTWLPGTSVNAGPNYSERFVFNPAVIGTGGLIASKNYRIYVRRTSNPGLVYFIDFTTKSSSNIDAPSDFEVGNPNLANCALGPFIAKILSTSETATSLQFNADGVFRFFVDIKEGSVVVRRVEMVYFPNATDLDKAEASKPNPKVQFFYNNTPTVQYEYLAPDVARSIEIYGSSCKSVNGPDSKPLVIAGTPMQFVSGYPKYTLVSSVYRIETAVNKSGNYLLVITDNTSNSLIISEVKAYVSGTPIVVSGVTPGHNYSIKVGDLTSSLYIANSSGGGGDVKYTVLSRGLKIHLDMQISGSSNNWVIDDMVDYPLSPGYEFLYRIAGDTIRQSTPLRGYQWRSNTPFRLLKAIIKKTAAGLWQWADANGITIDDSVSTGFTYNDSCAFALVVFTGGTSDFAQPVLTGMNPELGQPQFVDIAPDFSLPKGHAHIVQRGESDPFYTIEKVLSKGGTHIPTRQSGWPDVATVIALRNAGDTYSDVPLNNELFGLPRNGSIPETWVSNPPGQGWPFTYNLQVYPNGPLTQEQATNAANGSPAVEHAFHVGEAEEGWPAISTHWPMWKWFYERVKVLKQQRFGERNIDHWTCHNYYASGFPDMFTLGWQTREQQKASFNRPYSQWENTNYSAGNNLEAVDTIAQAIYLGAPDKLQPSLNAAYFMECIKKMGRKPIIFYASVHEWRPNNHTLMQFPEGEFYKQAKVPVDPAESINVACLGHIHGTGTVHWAAVAPTRERKIDPGWEPSGNLWFPNGASSPQGGFPHYKSVGYYGYDANADLFNMGVLLFANTFAEVEGGTNKFLKFRLDGGAWITPDNTGMNEMIDAFNDKRGLVYSREKNGVLYFYYLNSWGAGSQHTLEVENPHNSAVIWSGTVSGSMILIKRVTV